MTSQGVHLVDEDRNLAGIAPLSGNLGLSVDKEIERGLMFAATAFETVANTENLDIRVVVDLTTPAVRLAGSTAAEGSVTLNIFTGSSMDPDGVELVVGPLNLTTVQVAKTRVFKNPTVSSTGPGSEPVFVPAGKTSSAGLSGALTPIILSPGEYLIRIANTSGQANMLSVLLLFTEYDVPGGV